MSHHLPPDEAYLQQANELTNGRFPPDALPQQTAHLPPLDRPLLDRLAGRAAQIALTQPKQAWALTAVAAAAAAHTTDPLLQGLAHWHAARAANAWYRPDLLETAVAAARHSFQTAGEPAGSGWLAACDWQENAEPWRRPNYHEAIAALEQALARLADSPQAHLIPHCRLSLAYGYILTSHYAAAEAQLDQSEDAFRQQNDPLNQARCWLHRASALRRQRRFPEAVAYLEKARHLFRQLDAPVDEARASFQLGYYELNQTGNYDRAERYFQTAANQFADREIAIWRAFCLSGLVQVYNNQGRLAEAYRLLPTAREIYDRFALTGSLADAAIESGIQSLFRGDWRTAVSHLQQAEANFAQLNLTHMVAMSLVYQGDAYIQASHYRQALHSLEKALTLFEQSGDSNRQAECQMRLGNIWLALGRDDDAYQALQTAADHFTSAEQPAYLDAIFTYQAEILFRQQKQPQGIEILRHALALAEARGSQLYRALARRALGEALCLAGEWAEGGQHLQTAAAEFQAMDTQLEWAACQLSLGNYYRQMGDPAAARAAWERALELNQTAVPAISWPARAGLATLDTAAGQPDAALEQYRHAVAALARLRQNIWQPALAGSFLRHPAAMLDQAVALAEQTGSEYHTLLFLEESKAQTVNQQLATAVARPAPSDELDSLAADIRWLQQKLLGGEGESQKLSAQFRQWQQQLIEKAQRYDLLAARLERQTRIGEVDDWRTGDFPLAQFRQTAQEALADRWVALNYYLSDSRLTCVMLTPSGSRVWSARMTPATRLALTTCAKGGANRLWPPRHLALLGDWLLPDFVRAQLTPDTTLLISPHRALHRLPWAGLLLDGGERPLMTACIPALTPSWRSLLHLWQRAETAVAPLRSGLMLALSDFQQRHAPLPQTRQESAQLRDLFGPNLHLLEEGEAATERLFRLAEANGLAEFDFLHVASHAFADQLTGRLSGLALADRDLWLDEIDQLAPLPRLVTLSACSGILSRLFEGDEQVGLTIACLAAGAQRVVGSLWPLLDEVAAPFMGWFYAYLQAGSGPALALAQAQREAHQAGLPLPQWGSLQCIGQP